MLLDCLWGSSKQKSVGQSVSGSVVVSLNISVGSLQIVLNCQSVGDGYPNLGSFDQSEDFKCNVSLTLVACSHGQRLIADC